MLRLSQSRSIKPLEFGALLLVYDVPPGASKPGRGLRRAEAMGRAAVLTTGQPEVQSHPGAALAGLLLQSRRDAPQVRGSY